MPCHLLRLFPFWRIPFCLHTRASQVGVSPSHATSRSFTNYYTLPVDFALNGDPFNSASSEPYFDPFSRSQSTSGIVEPYAKKPDCFRRAAGRIRSRCADIEMDADERVKGMYPICIYSIYER